MISTDSADYDGIPGMVWYSSARPVRGDELKIGDWLDSLDHRGARTICGIWIGDTDTADLAWRMRQPVPPAQHVRTVMFSCGDTEIVRNDVEYSVVDPQSQVAPDGTPIAP